MSGRAIARVISRHAEEAAFLWLIRDDAVRSDAYSAAELQRLDHRLEGHVDGLRIAGDAGWAILEEQLQFREPGEVFAAAVIAFESGSDDRIEAVLEVARSEESPRELERPLVAAAGWAAAGDPSKHAHAWLASEGFDARAGLSILATQRKATAAEVRRLLFDPDPTTAARAAKAMGELGLVSLRDDLDELLDDRDPAVAWNAALSGTLLGLRRAEDHLLTRLTTPAPHAHPEAAGLAAGDALGRRWAVSRGDVSAEVMRTLAQDPSVCSVLAGLGFLSCVDHLLELIDLEGFAGPAGEAIRVITGVDLNEFELDESSSAADSGAATQDSPRPDAAAIRAWWDVHRQGLEPGPRYVAGHPVASGGLGLQFDKLRPRHRQFVAHECLIGQHTPTLPCIRHRSVPTSVVH